MPQTIDRPPLNPPSGTPSEGPQNPSPGAPRAKAARIATGFLIAFLLGVIGVETFIILEQRRVTQQVEAQSEKAYGRFLQQSQSMSRAQGADVLLHDVQYCWSKEVCIVTDRLTATAVSLGADNTVRFDDLKNFIVDVHNGRVRISPRTLQGMFNESVFNYPGSNLRDLTVTIDKAGKENRIKLGGSLKYFLWIPFEMDTNLRVDRKTNTLVISVYKLKVLGFIPATWLIELKPFNLQKLLTLPPNKYLTVHQNLMMVKPFGLFPPPRINGTMDGITVMPNLIQLSFAGNEPSIPDTAGRNSIVVHGGNAQFGRIRLLSTDVQVKDQNPGNVFRFSLLNYLSYLPKSQVKLQPDGQVLLTMPDHQSIPDLSQDLSRSSSESKANAQFSVAPKSESPKSESPWDRFTRKIKDWLKIN